MNQGQIVVSEDVTGQWEMRIGGLFFGRYDNEGQALNAAEMMDRLIVESAQYRKLSAMELLR